MVKRAPINFVAKAVNALAGEGLSCFRPSSRKAGRLLLPLEYSAMEIS